MNKSLVRLAAAFAAPLLLAACSSATTTGGSASTPEAQTSAAASGSPQSSEAPQAGGQAAPLPTGGLALADTKWALSGVNWTTDDVTGFEVTLDFTADNASGFAAVNQYNGSYTATTDGTLEFGPLATTKMAGEEAAMKFEAEYLAALAKVTNYSAAGDLLDLFAGTDQILTFTKAS